MSKRIDLMQRLRYAHEGVRVVTYEAGEQTMPNDVADFVLREELGALVEEQVAQAMTIPEAVAAMLNADPEKANEPWWMKDGRPEARELTARLERRVSAVERDAAWEAMSVAI